MSRSIRRSASEQLIRPSFENENNLNFLSDIDINSKRNSWWKNLSDNDRRTSLLTKKSISLKVLNTDSDITDDKSPDWWKNLSENVPISMTLQYVNKKEDVLEKQTSQFETDESVNENVFPKKSIFPIEEIRPQKSRYSHAFNLKTEKATQEEHNSEQAVQDVEIENVNAIEDDSTDENSNERKKNKKRRKTKKLFRKSTKKRKYSDIFAAPNTEPQEDFIEGNVSKDTVEVKKDLFKINQTWRKYSQAFALPTINTENEDSSVDIVQKDFDTDNLSREDIEEKKKIFQINLKKKKYSDVFAIYKKLSDNETSEEEVITHKDTSHSSNRSLRSRKSNSSKIDEDIQKRDNDLNNESCQNLEEEIVENEDTIAGNVSKDTVEVKKSLFKVNPKRKKYSQAFVLSNTKTENEETCVDIVQKEYSIADNISKEAAEEKKNLFQINLKKKNYSEAFAISTNEKLSDSQASEEEIVIEEAITQTNASQQSLRNRKSSFGQVDKKAPTPTSNRSLRTRKSIVSKIDEKNQRASTPESNRSLKTRKSGLNNDSREKLQNSDKSNEEILVQNEDTTANNDSKDTAEVKKDLFKVNQKKKNYSQAFALSNTKTENEDTAVDILQKEDSNEEVSKEDIDEKKNLFPVNRKKKNYSEAFAFSAHKILFKSDTSEEEICIEDVLTQKDASLASNRSLRPRKSNSSKMAEKSLQKNTSLKPNESNLSISKNKKKLKKTLDSSKKEINISQKTPQSNRRTRSSKRNQVSSNEKESTEVNETVLGEDMKTPKNLFPKNQHSKKHSVAFLNIHETPQNPTENIEHTEGEVSPENIVNKNTKEKQTKPLTVQELISKRKESLDNKNPKYSEAFMELMAMQKPVQKDLHVPSQNIEVHTNKESTDIVVNQLNSDNDTHISSIPSIDISDEIKHPLFRPKARKSLYSTKEVRKSFRQSKIQSEEERSTKKISKKRMSLRSTSPTDSGISKFFEESLISSTKLFINPNGEKSGGSDESVKKKRAAKLRKISGMNESENINIVKDKIEDIPSKNTPLIQTVPETQNTVKLNEKEIVNEEVMESVKENSKRGRKSKSRTISENSNSSISDKNHLAINKNNTEQNIAKFNEKEIVNEEVIKSVEENWKLGRKSKSLRKISENSNSRISEKSHLAINKNNTQQNIETEEINRVTNSPSQISRISKSSVRNSEVSVRSKKQSNSISFIPENTENLNMNRNTSVQINENNDNSPYLENEPLENLLTPKSINEIEKKSSVPKIPQKLNLLPNAPVRNSAPKNTNSKNIPIEKLSSSFSDDDPLEILLTPIADLVAKRKERKSTTNKKSVSNSNVIPIRSTDINERLNPTERIENWLSKSVIANNNEEEIELEVDINSTIRKTNIFAAKPESEASLSEKEILRRKKLLKTVMELPKNKEKKSAPTVPVKKITDFFRTLNKNEKLKPIPQNTNKVKKVSRPVCSARLIDGKPYYSKKLFRGERWCSSRFYKFLQNKMTDKYGNETINESENIMKRIVQHVKFVIKSKKYLKEEVDKFKIELAQRNIVSTNDDFWYFCFDYMPIEYRNLVVPMTQSYTAEPTVPYNEKDVYKKIIDE